MANQGAKKRKEENARHMKTLLRLIIASNVQLYQTSQSQFRSIFSFLFLPFLGPDRSEFGGIVYVGDLCSVEDGSFLLEFHMEALVRLDFDFAGLRDPLPAAGCYGET